MIDKLQMLIALAQAGHFGRAAESLGIGQSTLSAGIRQLEAQLGVRLVLRDARYRGLTPEGQSALVLAQRIVRDTQQLTEQTKAAPEGLTGTLRLAAIPTAQTWAAKLASRFAERHPRVRFSIQSRTSAEILSMLEAYELDAGITYLDNEPLGRVVAQPLYQERYMVVCPDDSAFAERASIGWQELSGTRLCLLNPSTQNRRIIDRHFLDAGISPEILIESDSALMLVANVKEGEFLTVLPTEIAQFLAEGKGLRIIPLSGAGPRETVGLIVPADTRDTPTAQALLDQAQRVSRLGRL